MYVYWFGSSVQIKSGRREPAASQSRKRLPGKLECISPNHLPWMDLFSAFIRGWPLLSASDYGVFNCIYYFHLRCSNSNVSSVILFRQSFYFFFSLRSWPPTLTCMYATQPGRLKSRQQDPSPSACCCRRSISRLTWAWTPLRRHDLTMLSLKTSKNRPSPFLKHTRLVDRRI